MKRIILTLCMVLLLTSLVFAYSEETATVHAHYQHPISGIVEDAGHNPGIGQGMVENVAHNLALFEEIDGKLYVCLRFNLANYISDVNFAVQQSGADSFTAADYQVVQSTETSNDYRFVIPSKTAIIRASCYIESMQRAVVFYIDFSDFKSGNSDFIALGAGNQMQNVVKSSLDDQTGVLAINQQLSADQLGYDHGLLLKGSPQLIAMLNPAETAVNQQQINQSFEGDVTKAWGPITKITLAGLFLLLVLLSFFFASAAITLYFVARYLKQKNDLAAEALYEKD